MLGPESRHPGVPYIVFPGEYVFLFHFSIIIFSWNFICVLHLRNLLYIGNVGDSKALAELVKSWARPVRLSSTKELLFVRAINIIIKDFRLLFPLILKNLFYIQNAEKGGYAVGAFNVYNLEGVEAVVAAAEEEQSPAILQVRSSQLRRWIF